MPLRQQRKEDHRPNRLSFPGSVFEDTLALAALLLTGDDSGNGDGGGGGGGGDGAQTAPDNLPRIVTSCESGQAAAMVKDHHMFNGRVGSPDLDTTDSSIRTSVSGSRLSVALHRFLPALSSPFSGAKYRRSKSTGHLADADGVVVVDDIFGPISIIGRQLSPRGGWEEVDCSTGLITPDSEEDFVDGRPKPDRATGGDGLSFKKKKTTTKKKKKRTRHHHHSHHNGSSRVKDVLNDDSTSGKNSFAEELGYVRDVIVSDDPEAREDGEEAKVDGAQKLIRLVRLSSDDEAGGQTPDSRRHGHFLSERNANSGDNEEAMRVNGIQEASESVGGEEDGDGKRTRRKARPPLTCEECGYSTTSRRKLSRHLASHGHDGGHRKEEQEEEGAAEKDEGGGVAFKCPSCDYVSDKERRLRRHLKRVHGSADVQLGGEPARGAELAC